jgi:NAD(P)-dependent dehydrogenase (short-subunit alcohol dehydrogenase family)
MHMKRTNKVVALVGMGPGTGAALARRFAGEGHPVAMMSRSEQSLAQHEATIAGTRGYVWDVTDDQAAPLLFDRIRADLGEIGTLIYNPAQRAFTGFAESTVAELDRIWAVNARGLFVAAQQVLPSMEAAGEGVILVSGATASLRGMPSALTFAPAKAAARMLAQALAREYGPRGIHVAHVVIDGVIDHPLMRELIPGKPDRFFLQPDAIADAYWMLACQQRSAWTFELDLRPDGEKW